MGVTGLWQVLQPCARPTNIATLNRKRLAVDASIWIYQFLKAVRDNDGNALRSSHVVGFFRRICKLLWFGILPVFVFDGGVPALKRQTIQNRRQRREGRREDASRTAGKLLAVQMQRFANEEVERQRRTRQKKTEDEHVPGDLTDVTDAVYVDELGLSPQERVTKRKFVKQDPYHLPDLDGGITANANPQDPRIMSAAELEEYARQFNAGEDINLYDFSNIDFDGDFFQSLPPADRYYILNAARLRSRLRMGLSKEQLEVMFPNRMDFSRFQVERVKERNNLTQRLMKELGMTGLDLTINGGGRIAGDMNREYILVKNDSAEGGWALGVVNRDRDLGKAHKPIDVDAVTFEFETQDKKYEEEEDEDFEDVPIEGLNRLPKTQALKARARQQQLEEEDGDDDDAMFVGGHDPSGNEAELAATAQTEQDETDLAIALSLESQRKHSRDAFDNDYNSELEELDAKKPQWEQKAVLPTTSATSGKFNLSSINHRANAEVNNPHTEQILDQRAHHSDSDSDSDVDFQAALAMSRKGKSTGAPAPVLPTISTGGFDGPLPFPKLDWSITKRASDQPQNIRPSGDDSVDSTGGGGFIPESTATADDDDDKKPANELPPWMTDNTDIVESLKQQQEAQIEQNERNREYAAAEEAAFRQFRPPQLTEVIEIEDDSDGDVEVINGSFNPGDQSNEQLHEVEATSVMAESLPKAEASENRLDESPEPEFENVAVGTTTNDTVTAKEDSPELEFEDFMATPATAEEPEQAVEFEIDDEELFGDHAHSDDDAAASANPNDDLIDMEDDQLLIQLAEEVEEHARFTNELRNRPENTSHAAIDAELRQLRNQQRRYRRDADEVTDSMIIECQALLRLFGIPFITAPMEAEAQCAELVRLGLVDGVITDDSDTFLFGGTRIYKNMFSTNKFVECYIAADFEREMSLDRDGLIALAQLLGSDYTEGLSGVGPVTAVEILSEFPGKDGLKQFRQWWDDVQMHGRPVSADTTSAFRRKFRKAQGAKLFLPESFPSAAVHTAYMRPEVDSSTERFQWGQPDLEGLRRFLMSSVGWSQERTDEVLVPVIRDMNKRDREGTQANITKYFQGGVGAGTLDAFAPRQKVKGSKRMAKAVDRLRQAARGGEAAASEDEEQGDETQGAGADEPAGSGKRKRGKKKATVVEQKDVETDGYRDSDGDNDDDDYQSDSTHRKSARRGLWCHGAQGGSVVDAFLGDGLLSKHWQVRGVTRDVNREKSKNLAARGVEVVAADVHDKSSVLKAMTGAHTVFSVTNYWDPSVLSKDKEVAIGKALADAAKEAGVQHYIWSSLKNVTKLSNGALSHVHHFDSKAEVEDYIRSLGIPATFFLPGFYMSNFGSGMLSNKNASGTWTLAMPVAESTPVPLLAARQDTGKFVKAIVQNREQLLGKQVLGATDYVTLAEVLATFKTTFPQAGATATYVEVPKDVYIDVLARSGMPGPLEMYENMRLLSDFGYYGGESLEPTHKLVTDKLTTWEEYIKTNEPYASLK